MLTFFISLGSGFTINVFGFFLTRLFFWGGWVVKFSVKCTGRLSASFLLTPYTHSHGRCSQYATSRLMGVTGIHLQCITGCYTIRHI
jgi:hypothetical protein